MAVEDDKVPKKIQILKAFIDQQQERLTGSEIANYCQQPLSAIKYHLDKMKQTILLEEEENTVTNKTYYYINEFFLHPERLNVARQALDSFVTYYMQNWEFDADLTDSEIELNLIELLTAVAWLFTNHKK